MKEGGKAAYTNTGVWAKKAIVEVASKSKERYNDLEKESFDYGSDEFWKILDKSIFNARSAAIYGFSIYGKNHTYLLNHKGEIDYLLLNNFLKK